MAGKPRPSLLAFCLPVFVVTLLSALTFLIAHFVGLPSPNEIVNLAQNWILTYGLTIIFFSALLEGFLIINIYWPGSTILLLAAALSRHSQPSLPSIIFTASLALSLAQTINYLIGRYGWYHLLERLGLGHTLETTEQKLTTKGPLWIWLSYVHPDFGAFTATGCGVLRYPPLRFLVHSTAAITVWSTFWALAAYLGAGAITALLRSPLIYPVLILWLTGVILSLIHLGRRQPSRP